RPSVLWPRREDQALGGAGGKGRDPGDLSAAPLPSRDLGGHGLARLREHRAHRARSRPRGSGHSQDTLPPPLDRGLSARRRGGKCGVEDVALSLLADGGRERAAGAVRRHLREPGLIGVARVREFGIGFETIGVRKQMECARLAEELGYGTYWVPEDYFFRGAFTLASAVACSTRRMRVGLGVINPYTRHPALTAMEFAALTEIAEGRTVLGIGAGV